MILTIFVKFSKTTILREFNLIDLKKTLESKILLYKSNPSNHSVNTKKLSPKNCLKSALSLQMNKISCSINIIFMWNKPLRQFWEFCKKSKRDLSMIKPWFQLKETIILYLLKKSCKILKCRLCKTYSKVRWDRIRVHLKMNWIWRE